MLSFSFPFPLPKVLPCHFCPLLQGTSWTKFTKPFSIICILHSTPTNPKLNKHSVDPSLVGVGAPESQLFQLLLCYRYVLFMPTTNTLLNACAKHCVNSCGELECSEDTDYWDSHRIRPTAALRQITVHHLNSTHFICMISSTEWLVGDDEETGVWNKVQRLYNDIVMFTHVSNRKRWWSGAGLDSGIEKGRWSGW